MQHWDVIVVGGGNSRFTAGLFRLVYNGPEDLKTLIPDLCTVGGIFWFNYPGGSGLTNGAVFGKVAGASAARSAG